jgi:hypothetical protein
VRNGLAFSYAGLVKYVNEQFVRKPVFFAYQRSALVAERCRAKGSVATACAKPY